MDALDTRPLAERVYESLLDEILKGRYRHGEVLSTKEIAGRINTSEMPIRLALKKLAYEGIVEINPRSNCRIIGPTQKIIRNIFETRRILELYAMEKIYGTITDEALEELHGHMRVMGEIADEQFEDEHFERYLNNDYAFHSKIIRLSDNDFVVKFHREINLHLSLNIAFSIINIQHLKLSHKDHVRIFSALQERSPESVKLLASHLDRIQAMVMASDVYQGFEEE